MSEFISNKSVVLDYYESHKTFSFNCYESGVFIEVAQNEVVKSDGEVKNYSALITTSLKNDEAIKLRDHLIAHYPVEAAK